MAYLSCSAGRTHFALTKIVAYLSCSAGCTHFARTNVLIISCTTYLLIINYTTYLLIFSCTQIYWSLFLSTRGTSTGAPVWLSVILSVCVSKYFEKHSGTSYNWSLVLNHKNPSICDSYLNAVYSMLEFYKAYSIHCILHIAWTWTWTCNMLYTDCCNMLHGIYNIQYITSNIILCYILYVFYLLAKRNIQF